MGAGASAISATLRARKLQRAEIIDSIHALFSFENHCERDHTITVDKLLHILSTKTDVYFAFDPNCEALLMNRIKALAEYLERHNLITFFHQHQIDPENERMRHHAIANSSCVLVCIAPSYVERLQNANDPCAIDFTHASRHKAKVMAPMTLDSSVGTPVEWSGLLGMAFGDVPVIDACSPVPSDVTLDNLLHRVTHIVGKSLSQRFEDQHHLLSSSNSAVHPLPHVDPHVVSASADHHIQALHFAEEQHAHHHDPPVRAHPHYGPHHDPPPAAKLEAPPVILTPHKPTPLPPDWDELLREAAPKMDPVRDETALEHIHLMLADPAYVNHRFRFRHPAPIVHHDSEVREERFTLLQWATVLDLPRIVQVLLGMDQTDPNLAEGGHCALILAAERGYLQVTEVLLCHPSIDVNAPDRSGCTALMIAIARGHVDLALLLVHHRGLDVSVTNQSGATALHFACATDGVAVATALLAPLLSLGADANAVDSDRRSPLHLLCDTGSALALEMLLVGEGSLDWALADVSGRLPADLAQRDEAKVELLKRFQVLR